MNEHIQCVFEENTHLLQCPVCSSNFEWQRHQLVCHNTHRFDISHPNYINFQSKSVNSRYSKVLFQAGSSLIENGFFFRLEQVLVKLLMQTVAHKENLTILDTGCGDGALLTNILMSLRWDKVAVNAFGVDSGKERVQHARHQDPKTGWMLSDMTRLPFQPQSVDVILNTLSPAYYPEFRRVLKPDGILIKTVPNAGHLQQLKETRYKNDYTNTKVIELFQKQMNLIQQIKVLDERALTEKQANELWERTPLTWNSNCHAEDLLKIKQLSVDLSVLVGQLK